MAVAVIAYVNPGIQRQLRWCFVSHHMLRDKRLGAISRGFVPSISNCLYPFISLLLRGCYGSWICLWISGTMGTSALLGREARREPDAEATAGFRVSMFQVCWHRTSGMLWKQLNPMLVALEILEFPRSWSFIFWATTLLFIQSLVYVSELNGSFGCQDGAIRPYCCVASNIPLTSLVGDGILKLLALPSRAWTA